MRSEDVGTEQDFVATKVFTHPSYHRPKGYSHDIALLKLEKPALLNRCVFLNPVQSLKIFSALFSSSVMAAFASIIRCVFCSQTVVIFFSPAGLVSQTRH